LIKVKGNQVAPAELEALLLDHPAVADAGVVGVTMYVFANSKRRQGTYNQQKGRRAPTSLPRTTRRPESRGPRHSRIHEQQSRKTQTSGWWCGVCGSNSQESRKCFETLKSDGHVLIWKQSGKILRKILRDQAKAEVGDSDAKAARL
jgi:4-coumarate--CoA ligase